jgi:hypothetical protein
MRVLIAATVLALPVAASGAAQATTAAPAAPAAACGGSPQRCDDLLQNQEDTSLYLGNSNGNAIAFTNDGAQSQRWDIYQAANGNYVIYNNGTNNVLTRGGSCDANGGHYMYCVTITPDTGPTNRDADQQWFELQTNPFIFQSDGSGVRCLELPGSNAPAGTRVVLFPCNQLVQPDADGWRATSS